jgi:hypothetical protein
MGKEQLDRTKRFTDDGKLSGIISSAKFVPRGDRMEEFGVLESTGLGQLFRVKGRKDEDLERELDVGDDVKVVKKRRTDDGVKFTQIAELEERGSPIPPTPTTTIRTPPLRTQPSQMPSKTSKQSRIVTLKIPKADISVMTPTAKKRRRVQFTD